MCYVVQISRKSFGYSQGSLQTTGFYIAPQKLNKAKGEEGRLQLVLHKFLNKLFIQTRKIVTQEQ